uniref:putative aminoacrylate hydrolase RutD n=1 Tax=Erigeron canadensis TaxID=72917 RepID=UPI001CB8EBC4|nr:putative aminoacrylate hydrolase RutD [Erigeron canadensis]
MPFCEVGKYQTGNDSIINNGIKIFYRTYGAGPIKVLMIIGLAATHNSWNPQIKGLVGSDKPNSGDDDWSSDEAGEENEKGIQVCAIDNRGVGLSSIPAKKSAYGTSIMAKDAIAVMDHLGWKKAHVFGHSMGGMIASKLAGLFPDRLLSLALLNVTGGGYEILPKLDRRTLSIAIRFLRAKTPEQRAAVDLDTHYTQEYLEEYVGLEKRRAVLYREYVKGISASGMQSNHGFDGQINACWTHKLSRTELEMIRNEGFLISVIHGRYDVIAQVSHARRLAKKLYPLARMVELHGGHLVSHERTKEVNEALLELINASESKTSPHDWTNLPEKSTGFWSMSLTSTNTSKLEGGSSNGSTMIGIAETFKRIMLYIYSIFVLAFGYMRKIPRRIRPVRVGTGFT